MARDVIGDPSDWILIGGLIGMYFALMVFLAALIEAVAYVTGLDRDVVMAIAFWLPVITTGTLLIAIWIRSAKKRALTS
ncbi:hypothetical protein SL003B_1685 [Polymorphum gilvum SL003B-26A1]|uniref:Transmembrane protein n=2 Tax=Polymorphum TaxID=991903 RepID=F2J5M9_POLGS|nr:hypothetical protein SL003B_1685 [Polymorphum gilvum SL003B-26A1]